MSEIKRVSVLLEGGEGERQAGHLEIECFSTRERMLRALKILMVCWLIAGVTVFIPIAHFFLVPGFLIGGPIAAYMRYKSAELPLGIEGVCPVCVEQIKMSVEASESLPMWKYCPACNASIKVQEN